MGPIRFKTYVNPPLLTEPIMFDGKTFQVSVSIGISGYNPDEPLDKAIIQSDNAIYQAKKVNPNGVIIVEGKVVAN